MRELILQLAKEGRTIFFSSHVIPDVEAICDHVALIDKGQLVGSGKLDDFFGEVTQVEVGFSGLDEAKAREIRELTRVEKVAGGLKALVSKKSDANQAAREILARNGELLWMTPMRQSLSLSSKGSRPHERSNESQCQLQRPTDPGKHLQGGLGDRFGHFY